MIREFVVAFVGLAGGLAVGSGFVAFLTVLGVIPRLTQLTKTMKWIATYERGVVLGAVVSSWISLRDPLLSFPPIVTSVIGLLSGVFVGMLAAALTEVLNVFPILAKRLGIDEQIVMLLMAMVFGKVAGSLFHWIYFVDR
ncbi:MULTISPECIES: stage V sporulation protein AB [Anoxybacillus]|uniref:Stage V sporulation protein AB n=1 Tax=Anoxybacillus flavithermus TaxID=33934 RepID=A0A178TB03_9BACL|nr:stage V sporulation protein AB [Anoxybacillus flavithermus]ASA95599.1 stage V sporulation protein AB [Anoxybacillus flavithermus]ELK22162.1 stage V sporulation protein AB [Anoxybacillus flavithermus TNO-09.006]MBE2904412.1 stage V sporulation protein AB [Anoxybacillus flavithermus]MBE2907375.1 stage V sporulation protein AB [Anoxybacillus flavithermus]MBE2910189.1 stage V sporulation protein AB [Anoxybacillus flavithermus]